MKDISVDRNSRHYVAVDGVLYSKDMSVLLQYPLGSDATSFAIPEGVVEIGCGAFSPFSRRGCLTSVRIPDSVIIIGNHAFGECGLTSVNIPDKVVSIGMYAFSGCDFESLELPNSVVSIGRGAFSECDNMTSIEIPGSVSSIGVGAFDGRGLTEIKVSPNNRFYASADGVLYSKDMSVLIQYPIGKSADSFTIPGGVVSLGEYSFSNSNLSFVKIPDGVTSIKDYAFSACVNLSSVEISSSVSFIGDYAFCYTGLTDIKIPYGVTYIGEYSFSRCENLITVDISNSVISIGRNAFSNNKNLISVYIPASVSTIGTTEEGAFLNCEQLTEINVSPSNQYYASKDGVLYSKDMSVLVQYPDGKPVESFVIPEGVVSLRATAFYSCRHLTSVWIPRSIVALCSFSGCENLIEVYCKTLTPPEADSYTFNDVTKSGTLYVPIGAKGIYETVYPWSGFDNIEEKDFPLGVEDMTTSNDISVMANGGNIIIVGSNGGQVDIYNVNGQLVYSGTESIIDRLPEDTYIVKVDNIVRKVRL